MDPHAASLPNRSDRATAGPSRHMERLLALAMTLLYRRTTTVANLARRFAVTERTIFRDLALLDAAGLPLVSSPGRGGGIGLAKGFRLEQHLCSEHALGVWSDSLRALSELSGDDALSLDADLVEGLLPTKPVNPGAIEVRWDHATTEAAKPFLRVAARAIRNAQVLDIAYRDREGTSTQRSIEPLRLVHSGGIWYLQAWCRVRSQYRVFRVPRIASWTTGQILFDRMERLRDLPPFDILDGSTAPPAIRLGLTSPSPDLLAYLGHPDTHPDPDGRWEIELHWPVDAWLLRWLCGQAPEVVVLEPASLREEVSRRLEAAHAAYARNPQQP